MEPVTVIMLVISMAVCLASYALKKIYTRRSSGGMTGVYLYSALGCVVSAVVLLLWGGIGAVSFFTCTLGLLFGLVISLQEIFMIKALRIGPMSYTMVITSCSTVFTALSGFFFFHEHIGVLQLVGIVLMVGSFIFATEKKSEEKKGGALWLVFSLLAFLCSGSIGFMQKIHQASSYKEEQNAFLVISFAVSFAFSSVLMLMAKKKEGCPLPERRENGRINWLFLAIMVISGVCVATNHKLNLTLSGVMPSAVFFPIVNGGNLVLTTLCALFVFREKLTLRQWIGVALGTLSVFFLCMPTDAVFSFALK